MILPILPVWPLSISWGPVFSEHSQRHEWSKCSTLFSKAYREEEFHVDGLAQDCSNTSASAMELLQFCVKPSICLRRIYIKRWWRIHMICKYIKNVLNKNTCKYIITFSKSRYMSHVKHKATVVGIVIYYTDNWSLCRNFILREYWLEMLCIYLHYGYSI